ncbi:MAG TPA: hypothetical protein VKU38_02285 [Ktedonobacteraceae bacterium]|nr:hypothetical protein [Ktedonobacteraceae bacterium]
MTQYKWTNHSTPLSQFIPSLLFMVMEGMVFLLAAILPLYYLQSLIAFPDALMSHLARISEWPATLLFPHYTLVQVYPRPHIPKPVALARSWKQTALLLASILLVCLSYVLSLRYLPRYISQRFIFITTALLGLTCVFFFSAFTSADVFSYIIYAHMVVIYHLNPLVALPTAIPQDLVYQYLYWTKQPSIYGPVWIWISSLLQWAAFAEGLKSASYMVIILRVWGLAMHLASTALIWSITGYLQRSEGGFLFENRRRRLLATLTFAWNPLLLFEACVNAHVDVTVLFFVLLSLWLLVREKEPGKMAYLVVALVFALACCIKVNSMLLFPGVLLFLWGQRPRKLLPVAISICSFLAVVALMYAPFWGHGALLNVLHANPAGRLNVNSFPDFLSSLYFSLLIVAGHPSHAPIIAMPIAFVSHFVSISIFVIFYVTLCWRAFHKPESINTTTGLVRWMMLAWLLYCVVGAPWFWPWYTVTFFGLYALVEATDNDAAPNYGRPGVYFKRPPAVYLLTLSMLGIYVFNTWAMFNDTVPGLPKFLWAFFRGCVWILPLFALRLRPRSVAIAAPEQDTQKLPETRRREMVAMLQQKFPIFGHSGGRISA